MGEASAEATETISPREESKCHSLWQQDTCGTHAPVFSKTLADAWEQQE